MKPEMKDDMEDKMKSKLKERIGGMLRNQWYLMIHSGGFWLAFLLMLGFTLGGFLHNVKNSWGGKYTGTLDGHKHDGAGRWACR